MIRRDAHHLCHDRLAWEQRPESLSIRDKLIAHDMDREIHQLVHNNTSPVPVPLFHSLQWVANRFTQHHDVFDGIDSLCGLLEAANRMKYAKPIEKEINLLAIEAIQAQIPYLQDGLPPVVTHIDLGANKWKMNQLAS